MKPGFYSNLSETEYRNAPGLNASAFQDLKKSELHYWAAYLDPSREPREPTESEQLGTALHCAILEPKRFEQIYVTVPKDAPRYPTSRQLEAKKPSDDTKAAIAWWKEFEAKNPGKVCLDPNDAEAVRRIQAQVRGNETMQVLLDSGVQEGSYFWIDQNTGILCKARVDWFNRELGVAIDLKSTIDASPMGFRKSIFNYGYNLQAAWYTQGIEAVTGQKVKAFVFAAIEKEPPFATAFYSLDPEAMNFAHAETERLKAVYAKAMASNVWNGYPQQIQQVGLPKWAQTQVKEPETF